MDFGTTSGSTFGAFPAVLASLFIFGLIYNAVINWLHRTGYIEGYTAFTVVIGVGAIIIGAAFTLGLQAGLILLALSAAAGTPMVFGDIARHVRARRRAERR